MIEDRRKSQREMLSFLEEIAKQRDDVGRYAQRVLDTEPMKEIKRFLDEI